MKKLKGHAYAVVNSNYEIESGHILESDADCACQAMTFQVLTIFKTKAMAELYRSPQQRVIPVSITTITPLTKKI